MPTKTTAKQPTPSPVKLTQPELLELWSRSYQRGAFYRYPSQLLDAVTEADSDAGGVLAALERIADAHDKTRAKVTELRERSARYPSERASQLVDAELNGTKTPVDHSRELEQELKDARMKQEALFSAHRQLAHREAVPALYRAAPTVHARARADAIAEAEKARKGLQGALTSLEKARWSLRVMQWAEAPTILKGESKTQTERDIEATIAQLERFVAGSGEL